jgi:hypothetical protein
VSSLPKHHRVMKVIGQLHSLGAFTPGKATIGQEAGGRPQSHFGLNGEETSHYT